MRKQLTILLSTLIMVTGCSWMPSMPSLSSLNPFGESSEADAATAPETAPEVELGVNPYLWQAALTKLSFMPMASTDASGGVIVTDWAVIDSGSNEQFKITVNVLSKNLRADCLKVVVFKRIRTGSGWTSEQPDQRLAGEIEKAILTQARKLYRRDLAARED